MCDYPSPAFSSGKNDQFRIIILTLQHEHLPSFGLCPTQSSSLTLTKVSFYQPTNNKRTSIARSSEETELPISHIETAAYKGPGRIQSTLGTWPLRCLKTKGKGRSDIYDRVMVTENKGKEKMEHKQEGNSSREEISSNGWVGIYHGLLVLPLFLLPSFFSFWSNGAQFFFSLFS